MSNVKFKKKKPLRKCKKKNKLYQREYRKRLKTMKRTAPDIYEKTKAPLMRRHKNTSRKRCRSKKDHKYAYYRYRSILRHTDEMFEAFFDSTNECFEFYDADLRKLVKEYRGCVRVEDMDDTKEVDRIREFVDISTNHRFFLPPDSFPQDIEIHDMLGDTKTIQLPRINKKCLTSASEKSFMIHEGILYHNDFRRIVNTSEELDLEICYTKRCDPNHFYTISLKEWLKEYNLTCDDLK